MSPDADFGLDADLVGRGESLGATFRRRLGGRYPVDPFGLDPQLADLVTPLVRSVVRVQVEGGRHIPRSGGAVLVANRGLGVGEPAALAVAVGRTTGRRLRVAGAPDLPFAGSALRRLGAIAPTPDDVHACLQAGHLVAVPLAPTWFRIGAGTAPLSLGAAMMGFPVLPAAVVPGGPLGTALRPWTVRIAPPVPLDGSYTPGDPLGAAELNEAVQRAVDAMLAGEAPEGAEQPTAGLAVPSV